MSLKLFGQISQTKGRCCCHVAYAACRILEYVKPGKDFQPSSWSNYDLVSMLIDKIFVSLQDCLL